MALTIAVPLTSDEQIALESRAKARGVSVDALVQQAVLQVIASTPDAQGEQLTLAQWEKEFSAWLDGQPDMPTLPDSSLSRENIYSREDEWR